jgi:hypothetical protein
LSTPTSVYDLVAMKLEGHEPLSGRAMWAQRALIALIVLNAFSVVSGYFEYSLYGHDVITQNELDMNDIRQGIVGLLDFTAFVVAVVMFIRWFKRAYANLSALGATNVRFARGWAIWSWFVPFMSLFRPKQIANDIWRGSDPSAPAEQRVEWDERSVPALFQWWWGVYLVWSFIENIAFRVYWHANDVSAQQAAAGASMFADSVGIVGAILALQVVRRMTTRQEERAARLAAAPEPA